METKEATDVAAAAMGLGMRKAADVVVAVGGHIMEVPGFVKGQLSVPFILGVYGSVSVVVVALVWSLSQRLKHLKEMDRLLMCWWAFTGLTHIILEGYFVFSPEFYKMKDVHFLAEVWKEYSKGDSRYAARDPTIVALEAVTAVIVGPACLLAVYAVATKKVYQYTLQLAISLGQLYGDVVYFGTVFLDGRDFASPGHLYYWFYFIFMNSIWIVVPTLVIVRSWRKVTEAIEGTSHQKNS